MIDHRVVLYATLETAEMKQKTGFCGRRPCPACLLATREIGGIITPEHLPGMKSIVIGVVLILSWAQLALTQTDHPPKPKLPVKVESHNLSPDKKMWCGQIKSAYGEAASFEPPMRSFVLGAVAKGLQKCDPSQVQTALVGSFTASLAMTDNDDDAKRELQTSALMNLLPVAETKVESMLPEAEPLTRQIVYDAMVSQVVSAKKFDRAVQLLHRAPVNQEFPFGSATQLMLAMPPDRETDKQQIFLLAMARDQQAHSFTLGGDDFAMMIARFWQHVPPAVALDAIHQVLDQAKSEAAEISLSSAAGSLNFNSLYEYRLFELVPILKQLDETEAEKLLNDSQKTKSQLGQFPNGIRSLDPTIRDTQVKKGERSAISSATVGMQGHLGPVLQTRSTEDAYNTRIADIERLATSDPRQAIAAAATLPTSIGIIAPRVEAFLTIARATVKKNPSVAKEALEEMVDSLKIVGSPDQGKPVGHRAPYWIEGMDIAMQIGESDLSKKLLKSGLEETERLRIADMDENDPNETLKAWWPSVSLTAELVLAASRISRQTALDMIREMSDPELRVLSELKLASHELGIPMNWTVMVKKKSSQWSEHTVP